MRPKIEIVAGGSRFQVLRDGKLVSQHDQYHKAAQAAVNALAESLSSNVLIVQNLSHRVRIAGQAPVPPPDDRVAEVRVTPSHIEVREGESAIVEAAAYTQSGRRVDAEAHFDFPSIVEEV
jgi:hypothetical protein